MKPIYALLYVLILMSAMRANLDVTIQINEQRYRGDLK